MCHQLLRYAFIVEHLLISRICCLVMHLLLGSLAGNEDAEGSVSY